MRNMADYPRILLQMVSGMGSWCFVQLGSTTAFTLHVFSLVIFHCLSFSYHNCTGKWAKSVLLLNEDVYIVLKLQ
jgi:hypothetical protein